MRMPEPSLFFRCDGTTRLSLTQRPGDLSWGTSRLGYWTQNATVGKFPLVDARVAAAMSFAAGVGAGDVGMVCWAKATKSARGFH
jgi:hypothetical protein